jgi:hypothetical protein
MTAPTTQETTRRTEEGRYFLAMAAANEAHAQAWEACGAAAAVEPHRAEAVRAANLEHYRRLAVQSRETAAVYRSLAAEDGCICGGLGRIGDAPCARCTPDLSPADAKSLLAAMNHEIRAEVTP